jgi:hypothetical protein
LYQGPAAEYAGKESAEQTTPWYIRPTIRTDKEDSMRQFLVVYLFAATAPGCAAATTFQFSPLDSTPLSHSQKKAQIFLTKGPARPYKEVGLIEGTMDGSEGNVAAARKLMEYAGSIGCDGVVVQGFGTRIDDRGALFEGMDVKTIHGTCIVYQGQGASVSD